MSLSLSLIVRGFALGASLIIAIGAQNAYVLRMGLARRHVGTIALLCSICDVLLIAAGQLGMGALLEKLNWMDQLVRLLGGGFLLLYGISVFKRACYPGVLDPAQGSSEGTLRNVILTVLALSLLNPHVYLENVLMLGTLGAALPAAERWQFGLGAALASFIWFFGLAFGAKFLAPFFQKRRSWQIFDGAMALLMLGMGLNLVRSGMG